MVVCENNLVQIGIAAQSHEIIHRRLPMGWTVSNNDTEGLGWAVALLPTLEQSAMGSQITEATSLHLVADSILHSNAMAMFRCPSDITSNDFVLHFDDPNTAEHEDSLNLEIAARQSITLPTANYLGVFGTTEADDAYPTADGNGAMIGGHAVQLADLRRGLSSTLLIGERTMATLESTWLGVPFAGEDAGCRLLGSALTSPNATECDECDECEFSSRHVDGALFLCADGHVEFLSSSIDTALYQQLAKRGLH